MEEKKPMTIKLYRDPHHDDVCTVVIDNNVRPVEIETRVAVPQDDKAIKTVQEWVSKIKKSPENIIGISPECGVHYKDDGQSYWRAPPCHVLQLCVGNNCLLWDPRSLRKNKNADNALKKVLSDGKFKLVGVGIEEVVKKNLEENFGLKVSSFSDLEKIAGTAHGVGDYYCNWNKKRKFRQRVVKLAGWVLKENWSEWTNRNGISWWKDREKSTLSDEKVKYGTLDAFLAFKMGKELSQYMK